MCVTKPKTNGLGIRAGCMCPIGYPLLQDGRTCASGSYTVCVCVCVCARVWVCVGVGGGGGGCTVYACTLCFASLVCGYFLYFLFVAFIQLIFAPKEFLALSVLNFS